MKVYSTDKIDRYSHSDNVFANREVTELFEEKLRIKNAVMETIIDPELESLTPREKQYWSLYRQGMRTRDIADIMKVKQSTCRDFKKSAIVKLGLFSDKLKKRIN